MLFGADQNLHSLVQKNVQTNQSPNQPSTDQNMENADQGPNQPVVGFVVGFSSHSAHS
jgi:hypothetical protein